jgi:hypothetical protein
LAASNVLVAHVLAQTTGGFTSWTVNTGSGPVLPLAFDYSGINAAGTSRTGLNNPLNYDASNANVLLGGAPTTLGRHLMLLATQAMRVKKLTAGQEFIYFSSAQVTAAATTFATYISTAVTNALNTQIGQDAMFQCFLAANGPFVNTDVGIGYTGVYDTKFNPMVIAMTLANVALTVNFQGMSRTLVIKSLPLWITVN